MGIEFEKLKITVFRPADHPIPVKQGQVRGNKSSFMVGLCQVDIEIVQISLFIIERNTEK